MEVPEDIQASVVREFTRRYPEFYASEQNAKLMREGMENAMEAGHSVSVDTLACIYHHLRAAGRLEEPADEVIHLTPEEEGERRHVWHMAEHAHEFIDEQLRQQLSKVMYVPKTTL